MTIFECVVRWSHRGPEWAVTHYDPGSRSTVLTDEVHMSPVIDTAWYTDETLMLLSRGMVTGHWVTITEDSPVLHHHLVS